MKKNKGFTLIELLVVIAIIGVLASVVLASLNTARSKGNDAAVKSNLANMRAEAAMYYDTNTNYGTAAGTGTAGCTLANTIFALDTVMAAQISAATSAGSLKSCTNTTGVTGAWAVAIQTKPSTSVTSWCVDSTGVVKTGTMGAATQAGLDAMISAAAVCL
jgi:prepilin-type N-terminal cleavage/methylation domain-containing protein